MRAADGSQPARGAAAGTRLALPLDYTVADLDELARTGAVQAFTAMMRRDRPAFGLDARNHADIADVCVAVRGRPADLELVARMATGGTGLRTIADALSRGDWDGGIAVLAERAAGPPRAVETDALERLVLAAAALCPDGLSDEALELLSGRPDVAGPLERLIGQGLVEASEDCSGTLCGPVARRYRLPLRALTAVRRCTADDRKLREAHCGYYLDLAEVHADGLWTRRQPDALTSLGQERRNIATALRWAIANGRQARAAELVRRLAPYWRRTSELLTLRSLVLDLMECDPAPPLALPGLGALAADMFARLGEHEAALDAIAASGGTQTPVGDEAARADQLYATGLALSASSGARAVHQLRRAVAGYRAAGDEAGAADVEFDLSGLEFRFGRAADAYRTARSALAGTIRRGDELTSAALLLRLGAFAAAGRDRSASAAYVERAMVKLRNLGAAAAVGILAGQVNSLLEPSVVRRATHLARLLGSFSARHRAEFADVSPQCPVGDRERQLATVLGERALMEAAAYGAGLPLPELFAEIAAEMFGSPAARPETAPSVLTRRETDVALLVGEGLTNREVAHRLAISEWTVVNHMRQIMRKLDCSSRVQVARWVVATL
ncbi:response regulator transcription factor [Actinospica durhamensis]|uniref:Response regulator transcription factor n=1 Tax=Actinospica durhamensis TaxID=1508375 RepID=A0A941ISZ3_9ACTN|nr:LuxR C-terminal-related transcriptional regulator [Actinospica durhamensis]MBR7835423.1 response regulator transcription factor [Actinospica durhamensis]